MTDEQMRVKIAEACGWIDLKTNWRGYHMWQRPTGETNYGKIDDDNACLPNYLEDLNACHEMEKHIPDDKWNDYRDNLRLVILGPVRMVSQFCKADIHATARQRCEAFLRTMKLWED